MSHHGNEPFEGDNPAFRKMLEEMKNTAGYLGPIGAYPHGMLTPKDEGSIQFAVAQKDGKVVIDFGSPVAWVGMTAQDAADLASTLMRHARGVARQNGETITMTIGG